MGRVVGAGRVATVGGSLAHTVLPQPVSGLTYNADNQLTAFGGSQLTYDPDGHLISDGAHTYTWDTRGHLVAIDGGNTASFVYGPFGRRISKTVYGVTTGYLYDGSNVVQELSGGNPSANLLSGGTDEIFTRTDSTGAYSFLRDRQGSTTALTDSTGAVQQSYSYGPYGYTSTSGNTTSNSYQYIGRETDASGMYYLRNRYYNPVTHSFLKEDPMGLVGGPNLYRYTADNPVTYRDPNGKFVEGCLIGAAGYEFSQIVQGLEGRKIAQGWNNVAGMAGACAIGIFTEGFASWAGAYADALQGLGPLAVNTEEDVAAAETTPSMSTGTRYVGSNEARAIQNGGMTVPNTNAAGVPKQVFYTPEDPMYGSTPQEIKDAYQLPSMPTHIVTLDTTGISNSYGGNVEGGTGIELITGQPIPAISVIPIIPEE